MTLLRNVLIRLNMVENSKNAGSGLNIRKPLVNIPEIPISNIKESIHVRFETHNQN